MGAQSLVIGKMFGEGFQYGKRKISAMPNEEFNALTFQGMMQNARDEMKASIPTMIKALSDMQPMVQAVIHEFFDYLSIIADKSKDELRRLTGGGEFDLTPEAKKAGATAGFQLSQSDIAKLVEIGQQKAPQSADILGDVLVALGLQRFGQSAGGHTVAVPLSTEKIIAQDVAKGAIEIPRGFTISPTTGRLISISALQRGLGVQSGRQIVQTAKAGIPIAPTFGNKKAAGQSQRLEKAKLTREIAAATKLRFFGSQFQQIKQRNIITAAQQKLTNLLARYRF